MAASAAMAVACILCARGEDVSTQAIQVRHRLRLITFWGIPAGARVLEIGCGQGDTTAALAYAVGPTGFVHGVDAADVDYGSPVTLGQARERLMESEFGDRIRIDLNVDLLSDTLAFDAPFDYVVFAHSLWYFRTQAILRRTLARARQWAPILCGAEWDPVPHNLAQVPHMLAALVQTQCAAFLPSSESNVRTLLARPDLQRIVTDAGWRMAAETSLEDAKLHDGYWEVENALSDTAGELAAIPSMPAPAMDLVLSELEMLRELVKTGNIAPLPVYAFRAE